MIIAARAGDNIPRQIVLEMIFMSTLPLKAEYGEQKVIEIFSECVVAYDLKSGCSYSLFENNRPMAFGFTFDAFDSNDSAPHLHVFSVYPSQIKKGYGSILLAEILKQHKQTGITLECSSSSSSFFLKSGFKTREQNINGNHIAMFSNGAQNRIRFKLPHLDQTAYERYFQLYETTLDSLLARNMIRLV
ncbi:MULTISPECIES: GNAT family N-acetyltransferase [Vibrio]|uniref:N-acetyltransferase n=1 Tax=Vibrio splendidus TaxID=29497 RepID=A0A2T5EJD0_VIBSP|nr:MULTISPECIES: GNAT family N-acetyltransferase [Vibrio]EHY9845659.1 GNAT family N-acetyltransferase [Vibrio cholerae]MCS0096537.1 GNAT family N-acetyltransferase [Vibrio cholerae]OEE71721.1 hypothetical protein A147_12685 [Vibrio splendidus FF-6]PTP20349.1 N-acetyltransferase [Vibrio splendidus]